MDNPVGELQELSAFIKVLLCTLLCYTVYAMRQVNAPIYEYDKDISGCFYCKVSFGGTLKA